MAHTAERDQRLELSEQYLEGLRGTKLFSTLGKGVWEGIVPQKGGI